MARLPTTDQLFAHTGPASPSLSATPISRTQLAAVLPKAEKLVRLPPRVENISRTKQPKFPNKHTKNYFHNGDDSSQSSDNNSNYGFKKREAPSSIATSISTPATTSARGSLVNESPRSDRAHIKDADFERKKVPSTKRHKVPYGPPIGRSDDSIDANRAHDNHAQALEAQELRNELEEKRREQRQAEETAIAAKEETARLKVELENERSRRLEQHEKNLAEREERLKQQIRVERERYDQEPVSRRIQPWSPHRPRRTSYNEGSIDERCSVISEGPPPRPGKTRIPKRMVHTRALLDLGYSFYDENDRYIIEQALGQSHVDEIVTRSKQYFPVEKEVAIQHRAQPREARASHGDVERRSQQGDNEGFSLDGWLRKTTSAGAIHDHRNPDPHGSLSRILTPSHTSYPSTSGAASTLSDSPWIESEGEAAFVYGDDPAASTSRDDWAASRLAIFKLAEKHISTQLGVNDAPENGYEPSPGSRSAASNSGRTSGSGASLQSRNSPNSNSSQGAKRMYVPDEDGEGSRRSRRPNGPGLTTNGVEQKLLACPYAKHDPLRYSERNAVEKNYRGCSSCYLRDINRVKQHLYRVHRRPDHYCAYCFSSFETKNEVDAHIVERSCERRASPFEEKMTDDQATAVRKRDMGRNPVDVWKDIYKVLFPDSPLPADPYMDNVHSENFQVLRTLFERDGRRILSHEINTRLFGNSFSTAQHQAFVDTVITESIEAMFEHLFQHVGIRSRGGSMSFS